MSSDIHRLLSFSKWNLSNSEASSKKSFVKIYLELQCVNKQISFLDYFNQSTTEIPNDANYMTMINSIRRTPLKIINKYSSHILNRVSDWILQFISKPELSADCVSVFFTCRDSKFDFFAATTFPSIYHHFLSDELQNAASKFIIRNINHHRLFLANGFISSFIQSNPHFFNVLWSSFDESYYLMENYGESFLKFLKSLSKAANTLTIHQKNVLIALLNKDKKNFGVSIIQDLFIQAYIEYHIDVNPHPEHHSISQILEYAGSNTKSPQFVKIVDVLLNKSQFSKWIPKHCQSTLENQTPIVLSHHELLIIQKIIQNSREAFNYPQNEPEALQIPSTAENNFECIYLDINLRTLFGSQENELDNNLSFMFENLTKTDIVLSNENKISWDRLSFMSKWYNISELDLFLNPQKYIEARKYIEKLPFKNENFSEYITGSFRNSMVDELKAFDVYISIRNIWKLFHNMLKRRSNVLSYSISNSTRKLTSHANMNLSLTGTGSVNLSEYMKKAPICKAINTLNISNSDDFTGSQKYQQIISSEAPISFPTISYNVPIITHQAPSNEYEHTRTRIHRHQRRKSINYDRNQANHDFKDTLFNIMSNCRNNDTKFWIYIRNLDQYNLDDKATVLLKKKYHELMDGVRLKTKIDKKHKELLGIKYLKKCSRQLDDLVQYKRGIGLLKLSIITLEIHQICQFYLKDLPTKTYIEMCSKYLHLCLLLSKNDGIYDSFVWFQKLCFCFPDFKSLIPQKLQLTISFYEAAFWQLIKNLDVSLFERTKDCCQYLFQ